MVVRTARRRWDTHKLLDAVDPLLLAEAFGAAASDIDEHGWRRCGVKTDEERNPQGTYTRCFWIAVMRALERRIQPIKTLEAYTLAAENTLLIYFDIKTAQDLFALNDGFEGSDEEGKAWAIASLRAIQEQLRIGVRALELIAGPDTD